MMPAHLPIIGETRTRIVAAYVWSLTHGEDDDDDGEDDDRDEDSSES
jgi:hypothetical protein